ncbi:unnamed protein product [Symbiodinium sp. KB8]|nr:unnamed protein product [Symbiodinium sp. KB8]
MAIGLQRSGVEYHMVIVLQSSMEYYLVIGLQSSMEYHVVIGLQSSMEYHVVIGLQSSMEYHGDQTMFPESGPFIGEQTTGREEGPRAEEAESHAPSQLDLLGVIAAGMKQLQEAQVRALDKKSSGGDQETVKPGTATLPELRAPEPETSPVEVQDWLQLLQAPMADLSDNSYEWWAQVQALALQGYEQWSSATPLERLAMKQPYSKELEEGRFARLNSRAASMLLAALDSTVRADLVMRKSTQSATGILYRVLTLYQPGGENEKRLVLDQLQSPSACADPAKAAKSLRDWERWLRRAKDIGVTTPDATVLARALSNIMKGVLENHPDAAFRTSQGFDLYGIFNGYVEDCQGYSESVGNGIPETVSMVCEVGQDAADFSYPAARRPPEEDHPEALKKIMDDASKMQLDELKLKAMKVDGDDGPKHVEEKGVLLDSGSTHVLRPAHSEMEEQNTKAVCVTLAGDEQRVLKQAPSGSILLAAEEKDRVQTIVPFGAMMDHLNCTLKWNKNGLVLVHPTHGRIKTRVRAGCPEMTDAGQAAEIIAELEMRRVEERKEKTKSLQDKLSALRTMEVKKEDWRTNLAAYAQEGCVVDGLQVLFKCPVFQDLPEAVTATMVPNVEVTDKSGWEYLKELPLSRRLRKRSTTVVVQRQKEFDFWWRRHQGRPGGCAMVTCATPS